MGFRYLVAALYFGCAAPLMALAVFPLLILSILIGKSSEVSGAGFGIKLRALFRARLLPLDVWIISVRITIEAVVRYWRAMSQQLNERGQRAVRWVLYPVVMIIRAVGLPKTVRVAAARYPFQLPAIFADFFESVGHIWVHFWVIIITVILTYFNHFASALIKKHLRVRYMMQQCCEHRQKGRVKRLHNRLKGLGVQALYFFVLHDLVSYHLKREKMISGAKCALLCMLV